MAASHRRLCVRPPVGGIEYNIHATRFSRSSLPPPEKKKKKKREKSPIGRTKVRKKKGVALDGCMEMREVF